MALSVIRFILSWVQRLSVLRLLNTFGTVAYVEIKMGKHAAGSSATYKANHITGSRVNVKMENAKEPDMRSNPIEGGILQPYKT